MGYLKKYLKSPTKYISVDKYPLDNVLVADFNKGEFPQFNLKFDYIVCSGIIEYLTDIKGFLTSIKQYGKILIVSYYHKTPPILVWKNNLTIEEFEKMLVATRWSVISKQQCLKQQQYIYVCKL